MKDYIKHNSGCLITGVIAFLIVAYGIVKGLSLVYDVASGYVEEQRQSGLPKYRPEREDIMNKLEQKIDDLASLDYQLRNKAREIRKSEGEYADNIAELKKGILSESSRQKISSYGEALRNKRISSSLALIQRQLAYQKKLKELEMGLNLALEDIWYLKKEAETDIKMAKVLDDKNILAKKISKAIANYRPYSEKFVIDKNRLELRPTEEIWRDINSGKI